MLHFRVISDKEKPRNEKFKLHFKFVTKNSATCLSKVFFAECGQLHKAKETETRGSHC